jgi:hypothetical protein
MDITVNNSDFTTFNANDQATWPKVGSFCVIRSADNTSEHHVVQFIVDRITPYWGVLGNYGPDLKADQSIDYIELNLIFV